MMAVAGSPTGNTGPTAEAAGPQGSILIGPTEAGKSSLLSVLELASRLFSEGEFGKLGVSPVNDEACELFDEARKFGMRGRVDNAGTGSSKPYEIELKHVRPRRWWDAVIPPADKVHRFRVIDGRGADVFRPLDTIGTDEEGVVERRREYAKLASQSAGLIVCVDANDRKSTAKFFFNLNTFIRDVARLCSGKVPFRRVAIVLTKADMLVEAEGPNARDKLRRMNACKYARELIGTIALHDLFINLEPAARRSVCCGFSSVYGFIPEDGAVNFIPDEEGGRVAIYREDDASWLNHWRPHGIIDPFVYLATGHPIGLRTFSYPEDTQ